MSDSGSRLFVSLTPHGFGHAGMTLPVLAELRRRMPRLALTIQTGVPEEWLRRRLPGPFEVIGETPDIGCRNRSAMEVSVVDTAAAYLRLHENLAATVEHEARRMAAQRADAVLSNISYVAVAAAARAGIPAVALSCLNWADIYAHYCGHRPEAPRIIEEITAAYRQAVAFLRPLPAMPMPTLRTRTIGPLATTGAERREELNARLGLPVGQRVGLVAFGGLALDLPLERWPRLAGWSWLVGSPVAGRADMRHWDEAGMAFPDLVRSCDVVISKPGYGIVSECAVNGTPLLYLPRPDWPESPYLEDWLGHNGRCLRIEPGDLLGEALAGQLQRLFSLPVKPLVEPSGVGEAADAVLAALEQGRSGFFRS